MSASCFSASTIRGGPLSSTKNCERTVSDIHPTQKPSRKPVINFTYTMNVGRLKASTTVRIGCPPAVCRVTADSIAMRLPSPATASASGVLEIHRVPTLVDGLPHEAIARLVEGDAPCSRPVHQCHFIVAAPRKVTYGDLDETRGSVRNASVSVRPTQNYSPLFIKRSKPRGPASNRSANPSPLTSTKCRSVPCSRSIGRPRRSKTSKATASGPNSNPPRP